MSFESIPILDLSLADDPATKPAFLVELRRALMEVGFLYIKNVGIPQEFFDQVIKEGKAFFDIPLEEKLKIEMKNAPSFLGYSRLNAEITAGAIDHREQIDLSTEHPLPSPDAPRHHNLFAPNQWPSPTHLPNFRPVFTDYMKRMATVSLHFTSLIAEAIGLPPTAFDKYFESPPTNQQHKLKVVKYPDLNEPNPTRQGVGPHKDSMLTSYLLQASAHRNSLQAQNTAGAWIDVPPLRGTLVVAIGQGLQALTRGVCRATTHRVLSPPAGQGARFSIPFFQGVRADTAFAELEGPRHDGGGGGGVGLVPEEVRRMRGEVVADEVEFTFRGGGAARTLGEATLRNRVKSHPDVGERWYPDILAEIREEQRLAAVGRGRDETKKEVGTQISPDTEAQSKAVEAH